MPMLVFPQIATHRNRLQTLADTTNPVLHQARSSLRCILKWALGAFLLGANLTLYSSRRSIQFRVEFQVIGIELL